jgi:UDP-glucuronate 4-epimerase
VATLVTGGSGVVGMHVARQLAGEGETVVAYSTSGAPEHAAVTLGETTARVHFVQGNIRDFARLAQIADEYRVEGVIHAAALTGEAQARARSREVFATNTGGTLNVLELARERKMRRVILLGSASEYGRRTDQLPITEEETNPEGMYAETKFLGHRLGQRYRALHGVEAVTVRISSCYGPHTRFNPYRKLVGNTLIAHLCRAAACCEAVVLDGGGDYPRDWTYAADTALGICLAYRADSPRHEAYNISSGRSYKVGDVVAALRRIEPDADVKVGAGNWADDPFQALNLRGPLDIGRASSALGFAPRYDLDAGLREYIDWWRSIDAAPTGAKAES